MNQNIEGKHTQYRVLNKKDKHIRYFVHRFIQFSNNTTAWLIDHFRIMPQRIKSRESRDEFAFF